MAQWRAWQLILLGIFLGLISGAVIYLVASQPRGNPIELEPIPSPAPFIVSVVGAVQTPGVYSFPPGSRVKNAVKSAGGLTDKANLEEVNLAGLLRDGQQVFVPSSSDPPATLIPSERQGLIDINTASLLELTTLPGIGESRAQDIISYRQSNGGFTTIEELMNIKGIGQVIFDKLKPFVTIAK